MTAYVDSSVLLRVALGEPGALPEWPQIMRGISSQLIRTECLRTLDRQRLALPLSGEQVATWHASVLTIISTLQIVEVDTVILNRAGQPMPTVIGTLDAIHLATALLWQEVHGDALVMATHDIALGIAARAHGLHVIGIDTL